MQNTTQRKIKFRAWDKKKKKMYVGLDFDSFSWDFGSVNVNFDDGSFLGSGGDLEHCELMQFTGLKDKNGKEQFELDLVKRDGVVGEIRWDDLEARFRVYCDNAEPIPCNYPVSSDWEVVGNKYEN